MKDLIQNKNFFKYKTLILGLALVTVALLFRFIPHPPNFSPLLAIAFFSGFAFSKPTLAIGISLGSIFVSDLFLGLHSTLFAVYFSLALIVGISWACQKMNFKWVGLGIGSTVSSILFFILTNFSVWLSTPLYTKNWEGLIACYTAAIPFFQNSLASTLLYSAALFSCHAIFKKRLGAAQQINC